MNRTARRVQLKPGLKKYRAAVSRNIQMFDRTSPRAFTLFRISAPSSAQLTTNVIGEYQGCDVPALT
jgi:hypothetical protein